jgi:histidinol dehydrogenase
VALAEAEGLTAHAESVRIRLRRPVRRSASGG